jgi:hypothetical protein
MASLREIVVNETSKYAVDGLNGYSVLTSTPDQRFLTVVSIAEVRGQRLATTSLIVHLEPDTIIIEHDINSKPLVDALVQAGIPREKIILAYAGEPVPTSVSHR